MRFSYHELAMIGTAGTPCVAFEGSTRLAAGALRDVALAVKAAHDRNARAALLVFDDMTGEQVELDLRGTGEEVVQRLAPAPASTEGAEAEQQLQLQQTALDTPRGPGRPRLGVVPREVTLLPRHWEWLARQPGGASVALRKLVDDAKRVHETRDRTRTAQEAAYRFMVTMAGNQPGFEEATRALFAGQQERFDQLVQYWPTDVREHALAMAARAFGAARQRTG